MLDWTVGYLERKGDERPRLSAEWLISAVTGLSRVELYMNFDRPLDAAELARMHVAVERRGRGEPLQYVTGEMPFRHIVVRCEEGVLIPRPETEVLVDAALEGVDAALAAGCVWPDVEERTAAREAAEAEARQHGSDSEPGPSSQDLRPSLTAGHGGVLEEPSFGPALSEMRADSGQDEVDGTPVEGPEDSLAARALALAQREAFASRPARVEGPEDSLAAAALAELAALAAQGIVVEENVQEEGSAPAREAIPAGPRVLDLCTGTGCIALSVAGERPGSFVVATDLSAQAVGLAQRNRDALGLVDAVELVECDLAAAVPAELWGSFAVVVSNPPYIPSAVVPVLPHEVADFEPRLALDGGADGLDVFRRILDCAPRLLAPGGWLCVELFEESLDQAADLVRAQGGWARIEVREDLTHRPRVLVAVREG